MEDYLQLDVIIEQTLHKKRSFRLRIFSVEVHNHCEFGQILNGKRHFCAVGIINSGQTLSKIILPQRGNNGQDIN